MKAGENITYQSIEEAGDYPVYGGNGVRGYSGDFTHDGDLILLGRQGAWCGNVHFVTGRFWASEHAVVVTPETSICVRWLGEVLRTMNLRQYSQTAAQPGLSVEFLENLSVPLPPRPEQRAIAAFLDRETAKIDALVEKKRRLIELLKEKRAALISHAVTKGLNPDVTMKDPGIEWLGQVPTTWEVAPLRRKWEVIDCKHRTVPFVDDGIPIASIGEVQGIDVDLSHAKKTVEEEFLQLVEGGRQPRWGDIIYSRNATVGAAAFVDHTEPFCMGQDVCLIRSDEQNQRYLVYQLRSPFVLAQLDQIMVGATFKRVNVADIKGLVVCCPPRSDQDEIARFCDGLHGTLNRVADRVEQAIACLLEYRTALISAAVTGKIDVRGEVA
jgi:type I restriction enzyme S subunit